LSSVHESPKGFSFPVPPGTHPAQAAQALIALLIADYGAAIIDSKAIEGGVEYTLRLGLDGASGNGSGG
jgi:hypothetical protein